jgi:hypothetical protein
MAMIIALQVSKEGREAWLNGTGVQPLFILTVEEISRTVEKEVKKL